MCAGKTKSIYSTNDPDRVIVEFRDEITAFNDPEKTRTLAHKGCVNNHINAFIMQWLAENIGVPTHFERLLSDNETIAKRLTMLPVEAVVRNYAAGGLCRRLNLESGMRLEPTVVEFFYKNDELGDPLINDSHIISLGWASAPQIKEMKALSLRVNAGLLDLFSGIGLRLVDCKLEFGLFRDGLLYLGDEFTPDGCRLWDEVTQDNFDKDRFRHNQGKVIESYEEVARRFGIRLPYK